MIGSFGKSRRRTTISHDHISQAFSRSSPFSGRLNWIFVNNAGRRHQLHQCVCSQILDLAQCRADRSLLYYSSANSVTFSRIVTGYFYALKVIEISQTSKQRMAISCVPRRRRHLNDCFKELVNRGAVIS